MEHRERLFAVSVEARGLRRHDEDQLAAGARLVLGERHRDRADDGGDREEREECPARSPHGLSYFLLPLMVEYACAAASRIDGCSFGACASAWRVPSAC